MKIYIRTQINISDFSRILFLFTGIYALSVIFSRAKLWKVVTHFIWGAINYLSEWSTIDFTEFQAEESRELRRFIGSPPPSGMVSRRYSGDRRFKRQSWLSDGDRPYSSQSRNFDSDDDQLFYNPGDLDSSNPRITISRVGGRSDSAFSRYSRDNSIVSASPSGRSFASVGSLVHTTNSLSTSLTLPPKLISYRAEDGKKAVQVSRRK